MKKVVASAEAVPQWFENAYGVPAPNPFEHDVEYLTEIATKKRRLLRERFPGLSIGYADPAPSFPIPFMDYRVVIACAFGAGGPLWQKDTGGFWSDGHPWASVSTVREVAAMKVPDWESDPLVEKMARKYDEVKAQCPDGESLDAVWAELAWINPFDGLRYDFWTFPTFVDLGPFLMGPEQFYFTLATDPDLSRALMEKCFDLSTSLSSCMARVYGRPVEGISSFGGDNSCILSPELYETYAMPFDAMLVAKYGNLPVNLHSCGASAHLYDSWAMYPNLDKIVSMQTRGLPEAAARLRAALPNAVLQITIHAPQFDFERESPERIRQIVHRYAEAVGYKDLIVTALFVQDSETTDRNIRALYEAADAINGAA